MRFVSLNVEARITVLVHEISDEPKIQADYIQKFHSEVNADFNSDPKVETVSAGDVTSKLSKRMLRGVVLVWSPDHFRIWHEPESTYKINEMIAQLIPPHCLV
jgi:hypothetical protein